MPTPFPGMDPFLERPDLWEQVHTALIVSMQQYLAPRLRPRYRVDIEERVYLDVSDSGPRSRGLIGKPDLLVLEGERGPASVGAPKTGYRPLVADLPMPEEIVERYLVVREPASGNVVSVIELLSPANKRPGEGRRVYETKRLQVLASQTHLVEVDLLRGGEPLPMRLHGGTPGDYRVLVSRAAHRPQADVYAFSLRDPTPDFPLPLLPGDTEPFIPLNQLLHELYDRAGYDLAIKYDQPAEPPLNPDDAAWAAQLAWR
jgi:hypothetical protein